MGKGATGGLFASARADELPVAPLPVSPRRTPRANKFAHGTPARSLPMTHACQSFMARIKMSAISGRVNSAGGRSPLLSISRTLVPDRKI